MPQRKSARSKHPQQGESRWPATLAVIVALALYLSLPSKLVVGPRWVLPALEAALLVPLVIGAPWRHAAERRIARVGSLGLIALVNLANVISLGLLVSYLVGGGQAGGRELIISAVEIWLTNVLIFGLWYWEIDRNGPVRRDQANPGLPDFLFPQMANPHIAPANWRPLFIDYLYVSLTNGTAFSPTDTMPLTSRVKALMGLQAMASLITVALVAARAVNILS